MKIWENGTYRNATPEEEALIEEDLSNSEANEANNSNALNNFFEGLAKSETNSISKIRELAKTFLNESEG